MWDDYPLLRELIYGVGKSWPLAYALWAVFAECGKKSRFGAAICLLLVSACVLTPLKPGFAVPLFSLMFAIHYAASKAVAGALAILDDEYDAENSSPAVPRFSLRSLIAWMTVVCVVLGVLIGCGAFGDQGVLSVLNDPMNRQRVFGRAVAYSVVQLPSLLAVGFVASRKRRYVLPVIAVGLAIPVCGFAGAIAAFFLIGNPPGVSSIHDGVEDAFAGGIVAALIVGVLLRAVAGRPRAAAGA